MLMFIVVNFLVMFTNFGHIHLVILNWSSEHSSYIYVRLLDYGALRLLLIHEKGKQQSCDRNSNTLLHCIFLPHGDAIHSLLKPKAKLLPISYTDPLLLPILGKNIKPVFWNLQRVLQGLLIQIVKHILHMKTQKDLLQ